MRLHNRVAAGKEPVGDFPVENGFVGFESFVTKKHITMKKLVGQVTTEEKNEIQQLFERRNSLNELAKILSADNTELYEKLVKDMGETGSKFQGWWDRMSQKYQWESAENGNWEINFETNEIYLVS